MYTLFKCCWVQGSGEQLVAGKHFQEALKSVRPSCLRSSLGRTELSLVTWEQIGGLDDVKLKLRQVHEQQRINYTAYNTKIKVCLTGMNWFYFPSPIKEYRVADEIPWGIYSSGSESASWCSALRTSRMCKDDARQGCSQLVSLRLPVCQRCWPLLSLCRRLREGFSAGAFFNIL